MARRLATLAGAAGGLALFAYSVRRAGVGDIVESVRRVGWGLTAILVLAGLRLAIRAQCWRLCVPRSPRPAASSSFTFRRSFAAFIAGDAVGSITPLGLLASEPTKIFLTRHHFATRESISSLALENLVYAASVVTMIALGAMVMMWTVPIGPAWRLVGGLVLLAGAGAAMAGGRMVRTASRGGGAGRSEWRRRLAELGGDVARASAGGQRLWSIFLLDLLFHALAVLEIYVALIWLLGDQLPTLAQAIVFESLNRVVTVVFKFVPFRLGVDEALTGALAPVLALDPAAGVALAVVRKIRNLFWAAIGLIVIAGHTPGASIPGRESSAN